MTVYQWLGVLGVPGILAAILGVVLKRMKKIYTDTKSMKLGIQALLRSQMIADYNKWSEREYAPIYAKESFEACWVQYENLGFNGVMNGVHDNFMALPTVKPKPE